MIAIELCYALPQHVLSYIVEVPTGTTIAQLWECLTPQHPARQYFMAENIDITNMPCGIFSQKIKPSTVLHHHDRLEFYRPLVITPMEARRLRHQAKKRVLQLKP